MPSDPTALLNFLIQAGSYGPVILVLWAWLKGLVVSGKAYDEMKADRDLYRTMYLNALGRVDRTLDVTETAVKKVTG